MSIAIIINPISGGARSEMARRRAELARQVLDGCGADGDVFVTEQKGHAAELATSAVRRGARLVIAWGGDGTVNEIGSVLAFGPTPMAIVPSGSGNGLARELGVSRQADRAILDAISATPRSVDVGRLGGRLFFSIAGVGFDAHVASHFDRQPAERYSRPSSRGRGLAGYVRITARQLLSYRPADYRIGGDVHRLARRALLVTLANSAQFGNGARVAPGARVDDGRLDLVVFEETSRAATICALPRLFTGGVAAVRGASVEQVQHVTIESEGPITFHVDGEPVKGGTCLDGRVHPGALRMCVR